MIFVAIYIFAKEIIIEFEFQTVNVPATFFINSDNLEENPKKPGQAERNAHSLLTTIQSGHVLADHSYDHMEHNSHVRAESYFVIRRTYIKLRFVLKNSFIFSLRLT